MDILSLKDALELCVEQLELFEKIARQTDDFELLDALKEGRKALGYSNQEDE